jgi:hypothetical protein
MRCSIILCLGELASLWNLVRRQTRGCFESPAEVKERSQSGDLPDCLLGPAGVPQQPDILLVHETRRLGKLAGVTEQGSGLRIQLVLGPCRSEFITKMFIAGQAANCRRVKAQSRCTAHLAIDYRCQHLPLKSAEGRPLPKVKVAIQGTRQPCDPEIHRKNLNHPGHNTAVLATNQGKEQLPNFSDLLRNDSHDVSHLSSFGENGTHPRCRIIIHSPGI